MMSAEIGDKFVAFKERTMDKILGGHYGTPKTFMADCVERDQHWNYLPPALGAKCVVKCGDPDLHEDKCLAAVERCKQHYFSLACTIIDAGIKELEEVDKCEERLQEAIFKRAKRLKRAADEFKKDNKDKLRTMEAFEDEMCDNLDKYELMKSVNRDIFWSDVPNNNAPPTADEKEYEFHHPKYPIN